MIDLSSKAISCRQLQSPVGSTEHTHGARRRRHAACQVHRMAPASCRDDPHTQQHLPHRRHTALGVVKVLLLLMVVLLMVLPLLSRQSQLPLLWVQHQFAIADHLLITPDYCGGSSTNDLKSLKCDIVARNIQKLVDSSHTHPQTAIVLPNS